MSLLRKLASSQPPSRRDKAPKAPDTHTTGVWTLDRILGGGLPAGRLTEIYGDEASGKSTTCLAIAAQAQTLCLNCLRPQDIQSVKRTISTSGRTSWHAVAHCECYNEDLYRPHRGKMGVDEFVSYQEEMEDNSYRECRVAWFDIDHTFDPDWAEKVGVDTRRLLVIRPDSTEAATDIYMQLMSTGSFGLFVLDPIAALLPQYEADMGDMTPGSVHTSAFAVNKAIGRIVRHTHEVYEATGMRPTHVWTNQTRIDIGKPGWNARALPGGTTQRFASVVRIRSWVNNKDTKNNAVRLHWLVERHKAGKAGKQGSVILRQAGPMAGHMDDGDVVVKAAMAYGVIHRTRRGWQWQDHCFDTKKAAEVFFRNDFGARIKLQRELGEG